ncbi:MAG: cytidine deaminase [Chlorobi bacterium]|nr:cytidine deaminase [Chlorobiota bacterium]
MKIRKIQINVEEFSGGEPLPDPDKKLLAAAQQTISTSYAPYSGFHVGAAVYLANGQIITGSNQENAAYPSGLCAERVALFYANSRYPGIEVEAIAISARADNFAVDYPVAPCGACRQVLAEIEMRQKKKIRIIMHGQNGFTQVVNGIENLLPLMFSEEKLKRSK